MSGDGTPMRKKRRVMRPVLVLVAFAILAFIVVFLIFGFGSSRIAGCFSQSVPEITVSEFNFEVGRDRMFAHMEGSVAAAGTLGVQVLDAGGRETLRDSFRMTQPAIAGTGDRCIAFDIGGSAVRVFSATQVIAAIEKEGNVVSAAINQNGWFCVVTQDGGGLRGSVSVYNNSGAMVYRVNLGSGFILSAQLSPDNNSLAVLNLTDYSSRITFYHGIDTDKDPDAIFDLYDGLIIDIRYLPNGDILAFSTDSLLTVDRSGRGETLYTFPDKRLGGYAQNDDFIALHLYDHGIGHRGRIVSLLSDGTILGEMSFDREIVSMSSDGKTLVILKSDSLAFFSEELEELPISDDNISAAGSSRVLAVSEDAALATSDNSAVVITIDPDSRIESGQ